MTTIISATDAARRWSDLLNRVRYRGETFDIVRNGEVVARLGPGLRPATALDLIDVLARHARDRSFADDLQDVQSLQTLPEDSWES